MAGSRRSVEQRYRYIYKPLVFCACLIPFLGCAGGVLMLSGFARVPGFNLGVDPVRYVLDVLGKTTLNLVLITLLVTPVRQLTGWSNLLRLRRMLGLFAFSYALLHFGMYIGPFQGLSWTAITQDIAKRPYITIGFAALLMLVPLAVTSTNKMMRRLGRRWTTLHRLIYLIAALGVLHYWKMLKLANREPLIYACILAALLGWRLWRRLRPAQRAARAGIATSKSSIPKAPEKA
ncbi:MAG TPA: protein-methionine-sulfoxide reductase heme-binding subunit MsrQ [Acidisoma sp.]|nr:protein-methionine-sulfoxide reductase heme-binding subunit MsrQ [Acidisoma sp.]